MLSSLSLNLVLCEHFLLLIKVTKKLGINVISSFPKHVIFVRLVSWLFVLLTYMAQKHMDPRHDNLFVWHFSLQAPDLNPACQERGLLISCPVNVPRPAWRQQSGTWKWLIKRLSQFINRILCEAFWISSIVQGLDRDFI